MKRIGLMILIVLMWAVPANAMICLDNTDTLEGGASVDAVVDYTAYGLVGGTFTNLAQGQLSDTDPTILYTAGTAISVVSVIYTNTHSAAVTVNLYLDPANGATPRRLIPEDLSLGAGYSLYFDGQRCAVLDNSGGLLSSSAGTLEIARGGTGETTDSAAFGALKQSATASATGVVELATTAEAKTGTDTSRAVTPDGLTAAVREQSWSQTDGLYIGTDQIRARDGDGLALYDDDGNGLFVDDDGNVGIGTTAPSQLLDITTTGLGTTQTSILSLNNTTTDSIQVPPSIEFKGNVYTESTNYPIIWTMGGVDNFGIGGEFALFANIPSVSSNIAVLSASWGGTIYFNKTSITGATDDDTDSALDILDSESGSLVSVRNDGNVGIGTASPGYELEVVGDIYASGDVSALTFTDRTPFYEGDALAAIKNIKGVDGHIDHASLPAFAQRPIRQYDKATVLGARVPVTENDAWETITEPQTVRVKDVDGKPIVEKMETIYKIDDEKVISEINPVYQTESVQVSRKQLKEGVKLDPKTGTFFTQTRTIKKTVIAETPGRDLGAMISVLTKAVQQTTARIEALESPVAK